MNKSNQKYERHVQQKLEDSVLHDIFLLQIEAFLPVQKGRLGSSGGKQKVTYPRD